MDPVTAIGLAASIIAVLQLTSALIKPATSSLGPSENDKKELKRLLNTVTGFQTAYTSLEHYLNNNPGVAEALAMTIRRPIEECKAVLDDLNLRLASMTFVRKHIIGRKWDKSFNRSVRRLDDARELFDVILQGDQSERLIKISHFVTQGSQDIGTIKEEVLNASERLSEIHLAGQTNRQRMKEQASQNQSELRLMMEGHRRTIETRLEKEEQRKLKDKILSWLTTTDPRSNHERACKSHKSGTGDWFIKDQKYQTWLTEPKSFFWLNGKPGCGKTVLSSTIIEETAAYCNENEGCVMAYFYFSFADTAKQQCSNMLSSLLAQLAAQVDITPDCLMSLKNTYKSSSPPSEPLHKCLQNLVTEMPFFHVYIFADAIDEIPDTAGRKEACNFLQELSQNAKMHVLMTSRREYDITECMSDYHIVTDISIQNPKVDRDIQLFVREQLKEDKKLKRWSTLHSEIEDVLSMKADGMFRWAACQLDTLKKCPSVKKVRHVLGNLPKTLDETYERILLSTDEDYQDVIVEALRWLCFSSEVMTVEQLAEAAVFSANVESPSEEAPLDVSFDEDAFFQDPLDILAYLSGLVVCLPPDTSESYSIVSDDSWETSDTESVPIESPSHIETVSATSIILLSHFSVKEYLVSGRLSPQVQAFAMDEVVAHELLASKCLYFILFFQDARPSEAETNLHRNQPFYTYAQESWTKHTRAVDYESELTHLIITILGADQTTKAFFLPDQLREEQSVEALYLAAWLSLYWPCKKMLQNGADVNRQGGDYGSALQVAATYEHENIAQLLIDHGADVNMEGGRYGSVLQAGTASRSETIQLLIDHGADINLKEGYYGSALQVAATYGHENIAQLLIDHGADVNMEGGHYGSALQAAAASRSETIVQLLINHGADVNIEGGRYGSALHAAVLKGYENIVQFLLNQGANVNLRVKGHRSALQIALSLVYSRNKRIIRLLLDHGAEISTESGFYDEDLKPKGRRNFNSGAAVLLLEHGAVLCDFQGGKEAEEALARKDFRRFVTIQVEKYREEAGEGFLNEEDEVDQDIT